MNRIILTGLGLFFGLSMAHAADTLNLSTTQVEALGLTFAAPQSEAQARGAAWPATVMLPPDGHEQIVVPLAGRVVRVHAASGGHVDAGQPLVTLHSPALVQLMQDEQRARAQEDLAQQTLSREQRLAKEGIGIERRVREADIALRQARIEREALSTRLALAGIDARKTSREPRVSAEVTLRAPQAGNLLMLDAQPGAWLDEGEVAAALAYTDSRWLETDVPLEQANMLATGQQASIQPGDLKGNVLAIGLTVDAVRQTVAVRVEVKDGASLRLGQRVATHFSSRAKPGHALWRVPRSAIVDIDGHDSVFVRRGKVLLPLPVTRRGHEGHEDLVEAELQSGDGIVSQGAIALKAAWQAREAP
ncbi:MAG: HlyD family efflux transporter periplasmic adaptor subunit [Halothiobacillaceae bacterium]|nr:MAG: HlyD family efflux transporter periplasmic adaptor subunit [Halothiobacillaceae bacterium]